MLKRRTILKAGAASLLASPFVAKSAFGQDFSMRWGMSFVNTDPIAIYAQEAADNIRERTDGAVQIEVYPDSQLGNDNDLLSQVRSGAIDFYSPSPFTIAQLVASASLAGMPFTMNTKEDVERVSSSRLMEVIDNDFQRVGIKSVSSLWTAGVRQITNTVRPIERPEDLAGMKIRVPTSPVMLSLFETFGASPVAMNVTELYLSLQSRLVDAQENPLVVISTRNFYEVQTYCSMTSHIFGTCFQVASLRTWPGLPDDMQAIVLEEMDASAARQREAASLLDEQLEEELAQKGLQFNHPDLTVFREKLLAERFFENVRTTVGDDAFNALEEAVGSLN